MLLVGFPVHEFAHALAAYRLGDSTAKLMGRLTLNPIAHFDPLGGILLAVTFIGSSFGFGWAKPTPVNPYNLRYGRRGESLVALAGPLSNLIIAAAMAIPLRLIWHDQVLAANLLTSTVGLIVWNIAIYFFFINCALFVFNLVPIPPLDGWKMLLGLVDARTSYTLRQYEQYAILLLFALILLGGRVILPLILFVADFFTAGARPIAL